MLVGRFAPSPSGRMHLGNLFSALLAWLSVRSAGGQLALRIEDLDPERCKAAYADQLRDDLRWLGLDWDWEGQPQSQRGAVYDTQFRKLEALGLVYPCFCSRAQLHAASAPHASDGKSVYAGTCRDLTPEERARRALLKKPAWRLTVPNQVYAFTDGLQGAYSENLARDCGDFIIRRADGVCAYQLAVVTDDAEMGVTQVVRGRDLLDSTPRQLYLHTLLGLTPPTYYHVPLLLSPDGRRLSKRDRDLDMGYLRVHSTPVRILGLLAWLSGLREKFAPVSAQALSAEFSWNRVRKTDIVVENTHLNLLLGE